jgi:NSS family neurotransmitter:Na+ symporter
MEEAKWSGRTAFVLASIGSAIGLGNVWRFPYIAYKFGGGAFIVAYIIALILIGIPMLLLEFSIGYKFKGSAPYSLAKLSKEKRLPINFEWLGWFAVFVGFGIVTYYSVIMGWSFDYLYYSLTTAWGENTKEFFFQKVLGLTSGVFELGKVQWPIVLGLLVSWVWIVFSIWKGAKTVGKVVYVTVTMPWMLLLIFVIRGLTLPGAVQGINYYLTPNWKELLNPALWHAAISQIFFSLTVGFGVMIAYASFLPEGSDIVNNAILIALADAATAFVAGFAVFSTLGYYAQLQGVSVAEVVRGGPELAFVTYPTIISKLPLAPLFGIFFFLMLLTLAIDSAFSLVEAFIAALMDKFGTKREYTNIGVAILAFLIGIIYTTGAGLYWLDIVDHFMNHFGLFTVAFLESILIGWLYGSEEMREFANSVSDRPIGKWWNISVKFIVPLSSLIIFVSALRERIREPYGGYPRLAEVIGGWAVLAIFLILAIYLTTRKTKRSF